MVQGEVRDLLLREEDKKQIPLPPRRSKLWSAVRMRDRNDRWLGLSSPLVGRRDCVKTAKGHAFRRAVGGRVKKPALAAEAFNPQGLKALSYFGHFRHG